MSVAIAYAPVPLRDARWKDARAAREYDAWVAALELEEKANRTRYHYASTIQHLLLEFPEKAVDEFTDADLSQLLRRYPPGSWPARRSHLNSFFRFLRRTRRIPENPLDYIVAAKRHKRRVHDVFSEAEIALLCGLPSPDGHLMTLLFETGIRKGEARGLARKHISLQRGELVVYGSHDDEPGAKGGKDRIVPLTQQAQQAIADLDLTEGIQPTEFLWYSRPGGSHLPQRSRPVSDGAFARWYRRGVAAAGVRYRKPHMTRHSFTTRWLVGREMPDGTTARLSLHDLQLWLGHESISTTGDAYSHLTVHDVARRVRELETIGTPV